MGGKENKFWFFKENSSKEGRKEASFSKALIALSSEPEVIVQTHFEDIITAYTFVDQVKCTHGFLEVWGSNLLA